MYFYTMKILSKFKIGMLLSTLVLLSSINSFAQHRIKTKDGTSVYCEITKVSEEAIHYNFYRQDHTSFVVREEVEFIENLVLDPYLLLQNFTLKNPYEVKYFSLSDEVVFKNSLKINGLHYKRLDSKIIDLVNDSLTFISFVDDTYLVRTIHKDELEIVHYSAEGLDYIASNKEPTHFLDVVITEEGDSLAVFIYELGYQGIKYSITHLKAFERTYTTNKGVKYNNVAGLEFLSYNSIAELNLANGLTFHLKYYKHKKQKKERKLNPYPKLTLAFGGSFMVPKAPLEFGNWNVIDQEAIFTKDESISKFTAVNAQAQIILNQDIDIILKYGYLKSNEVAYHARISDLQNDWYFTHDANFTNVIHLYELGIGYQYKGWHIGFFGNAASTRSAVNKQSKSYYQKYPYSVFNFEAYYKNVPTVGYGIDLDYTFDLGKVDVMLVAAYDKFDFELSKVKVINREFGVAEQEPDVFSNINISNYYNTLLPLKQEWKLWSLSLMAKYQF
jgi:hypothetical protein